MDRRVTKSAGTLGNTSAEDVELDSSAPESSNRRSNARHLYVLMCTRCHNWSSMGVLIARRPPSAKPRMQPR